jgi:DNA polymerase-1
MARYYFDTETNGFLDDVNQLHSLVLKDLDTAEVFSYYGSSLKEGLERLASADMIVGHNSIRYDVPVLNKLYPKLKLPKRHWDTMVMARTIHTMIREEDAIRKVPGDIFGLHSLKAWGYRLLGSNGKQAYTLGFDSWNPTMQAYCEQDVEVGFKLFHYLDQQDYSKRALKAEHKVAELCAKMERNGFPFDVPGAASLYASLAGKRETLKVGLQTLFPPWEQVDRVLIPKRDNKSLGYLKGVPVTKMKTVSFNPASRAHVAKKLTEKYSVRFPQTEKGNPKVDEKVLDGMPFPEAKRLAEFYTLQKLLGYIGDGEQSWLKLERQGKIHASYNPMGAVTARASHSYPNIAQVPKCGNPYGKECRSLFGVPPGWVQLGADMSGLELRCLAHFMAHWDHGEYGKVVTEGDVHTVNQQAAGLPTRDNAKTFIYAFLYGAGDAKIGSIIKASAGRGKRLKEDFLANLPALGKLKNHVATAAKRGWLKGLDDRRVPVRSEHAALNTLLQSAGALLCKEWITAIEDTLQGQGLKHGWDGDYAFLAWVHDEVQIAVRPGLEELVGTTAITMAAEAGRRFDFACPLTAEYKTGSNWSETH